MLNFGVTYYAAIENEYGYSDKKECESLFFHRQHDYVENLCLQKKLLELKHKFSKVARYKANMQKSIIFLNAITKQ